MMGIKQEETLSEIQLIKGFQNIEEFVLSSDPQYPRRESFLVPIERVVLADNIRPFDGIFIDTLAQSIERHGQLQECIGDIVYDESGQLMVRIIAGQHRFRAITKLNLEGKNIPVRVSLVDRELDPYEVIEIQITENLHNKMTSSQEAHVINSLWQQLRALRERDGSRVSVAEFARHVSRSPDTVRDAIRYVEGVSPIVQRLVDEKILPYSQAILLVDVPNLLRVNGQEITYEDIVRKQISLAQLFVTKGYTYERARKHMAQLKFENSFSGPLFGDDWREMEVQSHIIAIRDESDKKGRDAAGWFVKIIKMAKILDEQSRVEFSDAVRDSILELGMSIDEFKTKIRPFISERQYAELFDN